MPADAAELSSISSTLEQLVRRVAEMAERAESSDEDDVAAELFAVERALEGAGRRLERMVQRDWRR